MSLFKKSFAGLSAIFLGLVFILASVPEADAQFNRRQIKSNNKKMRNFRGRKAGFSGTNQYSFVGVTVNGMNYFGDLAPLPSRFSTDLSFTRPALGITAGHRFGPFYTLRAQFTYGTLSGDDFESADPLDDNGRYRYVRNLQFRNRITELSVTGVFDLFRNEYSYVNRLIFTPYAYIGLALFYHNPKGYVNENSGLPEAGTWVALQPLGTEGQFSDLPETAINHGIKPYKRLQISIPLGAGIRYKMNDKLDFSFETGIRYLFTDYIDDVSANYVDLELLPSDLSRAMADRSRETTAAVSGDTRNSEVIASTAGPELPAPGGYVSFGGYGREFPDNVRGNKNDNDMYVVTTIRVTYVVGKTYRRAKFR